MLILLQQVTEGQLIKSAGRRKKTQELSRGGLACAARRRRVFAAAARVFRYFAFWVVVGISTLNTCNRICVPDSSLTLSVFDTITGPGVLALGAVLRLKPFSPLTPNGIPMLMGVPPVVVSSWADEPSAWLLGDCLTVIEDGNVVVLDAWDMDAFELVLACPRLAAALFIPPTGAVPLSLAPTIMEGGSICEGWSTREGRGAGGATACTTA